MYQQGLAGISSNSTSQANLACILTPALAAGIVSRPKLELEPAMRFRRVENSGQSYAIKYGVLLGDDYLCTVGKCTVFCVPPRR